MAVLGYQSGMDQVAQRVTAPLIYVWERFAEERKGEYLPKSDLNLGIGPKRPRLGTLRVPSGPWTIQIEAIHYEDAIPFTEENPFTLVRTTFIDPLSFWFDVTRAGPLYYIGEMFGLRDIQVGHFLFDDAFRIRSNCPAKIRDLLSDEALRQSITRYESIGLTNRKTRRARCKEGTPISELRLQLAMILGDAEQLARAVRLIEQTLCGLCRIGCSRQEATGVLPP